MYDLRARDRSRSHFFEQEDPLNVFLALTIMIDSVLLLFINVISICILLRFQVKFRFLIFEIHSSP